MGIFRGNHPAKICPEGPDAMIKASPANIISAYLQVLDGIKSPLAADLELPFPKDRIAQAILCTLADDPDSDLRKRLEIGYVLLESFVSYDEYRAVQDFKKASLCAEKLADSQDPSSILKSARILKKARGERAVRIQEKIHEKMKKRQLELLDLQSGEAA
ncbi:MAG: hypothetical protein ACP5SH_01375 [Syntrophobacteraceae bacterium]